MAKIQRVDYEAIPAQVKEMKAYGKQLNSEMTKAYASIVEMHDSWYGRRYDQLVKIFNNIIPQLNDMLELVVTDIPYALGTVANNYSRADRGVNVTTVSDEAPKKITNITVRNDVGMKFLTSNVATVQKNISTNFTNAKDQMNKIELAYRKIEWQSEASEAFKSKFTKLKNEIVKSFEDINTQFIRLMQQAQQDIQNAENANNVN